MKKIFLSILISSLSLNPLFGMKTNNNPAEMPVMEPIQAETKAPDATALSDLAKKIEDLTTAVNNADPSQLVTEETRIQKILAKLSYISEKLSPVPGKISTVFNWISDRLDTILTKKGAVKTALILGLIFATYCHYYPPEFLKGLVEGMVSKTASGAATVANAATKGLLSGVGQGIKDNKEELKKLFTENKEAIKEFVNEIAYEAAKIKTGIDLNTKTGELAASWWNNWGTSLLLKASDGLAYGIPFVLSTAIGLILKNKFEPKAKQS